MNIINEHGYRLDGRKPHQIRNINCRLGVYPQADGSAYIEQGNTKVMVAVYGPAEARQRSRQLEDRCAIHAQYSMATFSVMDRKNRPRGDRKSTEFGRLLEKTFEAAILTTSFPRAQIDIYCEVLQGDGSNLAACVNAATLALSDAGIPMRGLVAAATCGITDSRPVVDVSGREETDMLPRVTMATISGRDETVLVELQNRVHVDHLSALLKSGRDTCAMVHECLHAAIRSHLIESAALL